MLEGGREGWGVLEGGWGCWMGGGGLGGCWMGGAGLEGGLGGGDLTCVLQHHRLVHVAPNLSSAGCQVGSVGTPFSSLADRRRGNL